MKRHIILFIISFLLVGGGLCTFTYFNIKKQETSTKINDYGLLNHYFKNKEIPNDCNLFVYSGETYKIQGITLKLLSYIFDGHQAKCVFSVFGENKKDVEEFGIDTGGEEEIRNCNLLSPRELGRAEEEMVKGIKYIYWDNAYRPNEDKVIHLKFGSAEENLHTFYLKETTDKISFQGIDYKIMVSPIGMYAFGSGLPHEVSLEQENGETKELLKDWKPASKKLYLFSEFVNDEMCGSYYGFRKIITVKDKKIIAR